VLDRIEIHITSPAQCSHCATHAVPAPRRVSWGLEGVIPLIPGMARLYETFRGDGS
jgi:hypothetical protein